VTEFEEFGRSLVAGEKALKIVSAAAFAAVDEPGANVILGDLEGGALIAEGSAAILYGDGGTGKTTIAVDLGCHLAAGDDWLGILVPRPVRVLLLEAEGPRPQFP
jgi:hypothetical protein